MPDVLKCMWLEEFLGMRTLGLLLNTALLSVAVVMLTIFYFSQSNVEYINREYLLANTL